MRQCCLETLACLVDEIGNALVTYLSGQGKGIDKHTHRVADAEVASSVGNRSETHVVIASETRERIFYGG